MAQQLVRPPTTDQPPRMTYEEYLDWTSEHPHAEWVDGEVIEFMTVKGRHALVFGFLFELVRRFIRIRQLGLVLSEPFEMRILNGRSARLPDIFVVLNEHLDRYSDDRLDGPADLVVEIVSDDSVTRDRDEKRDEYAAAGIPEYWIVEGREGRDGVSFLTLQDDGSYVELGPDAQGRLHSRVLTGFWLDPAWLAGENPPNLYTVLAAIATDASAEFEALARQASSPDEPAARSGDAEPS